MLKISKLLSSPNIAELLDKEYLEEIGDKTIRDFERDLSSRADWEERTADAMKLALQVVEDKTYPWPQASNVKFPLLTIAALQFHARAYPALVPSNNVVKCKVYGNDKDGRMSDRADRISAHMSYQVLEEDEGWEEQMDRVLITQPIIGCAFKKTYFNPVLNHNVSENILAKDLVVPYFTKSLEKAIRISHVLYMTPNDIHERVVRGVYIEPDDNRPITAPSVIQEAQDSAQGMTAPVEQQDNPYELIEQHCYWDLDGDGYAEPYIVTVQRSNRQVLRIVARYFEDSILYSRDKKIISITPEHYFVKYPFIPSPDGGFYDLGFGVLLGPLNESINTALNQIIDAGTLSNLQGGFLGRGVKFRGGESTFKPGEWKKTDSPGDDLRKNIVPLPTNEPSRVLFDLLSLMISYGERIAGATDIMTGVTPGQNTPAETSRTAVNQGMKIFSGIYKRTYRALKNEFRMLYRLNQLYLGEGEFEGWNGKRYEIDPKDYVGPATDIRPTADPNVAGDEQKLQQAQYLMQASVTTPGFDRYQVTRKFLEAIHVSDIDRVYPDPKGPNAVPPPPNPKVQVEQLKLEAKKLDAQIKMKLGVMQLMADADVNRAKIEKMEAEAIKALAEANGVNTGHQISLLQTQIGAAKAHQEGILKAVKIMQDAMKSQEGGTDEGIGMEGMGQSGSDAELSKALEQAQTGGFPGMGV